jgi:hypothetical protein
VPEDENGFRYWCLGNQAADAVQKTLRPSLLDWPPAVRTTPGGSNFLQQLTDQSHGFVVVGATFSFDGRHEVSRQLSP